MGQGQSSVNYNYVYNDEKKFRSDKQDVSKKMTVTQEETEKTKKTFNQLLNVLKYHTNMISIDKNFVIQNKIINDELEKKINNLKILLKNNNENYLKEGELYKQKQLELDNLKRYVVALKYSDIGLFIVIVVLMGIKFIKK